MTPPASARWLRLGWTRRSTSVPNVSKALETDVLAYTGFPAAHWSKIWSNNPVRHEASRERVEVKGLHCWAVAAA